ncbi:MAG: single-stranded DNA-binding protein [Oligoflexales bacterium]|nr:single-stranded DNA-binding protein [Oligoflexales bacterium]
MAGSFNKVHILGNLGNDPELRYTQNQVPVLTLNIATTEYRKGADGQAQNITDWHRVVVWNRLAENCAKFLKKGRSVFIEGRLQTRSWDDQSGQKRYITEIVAQNIQFIGGGRGEEADYSQGMANSGASFSGQAQNSGYDNMAPTSGSAPSNNSPARDSFDLNMASVPDLDDIPF